MSERVSPDHPAYCKKQARKTPLIPTHNGFPKCLACGKDTSKRSKA